MVEFSRKTVIIAFYFTLTVMAIIDSIGMLGGLPLGPFASQPWIQSSTVLRSSHHLGRGLWNSTHPDRLEAYVLLWWIRILTVAKGILTLGLFLNLRRHHIRNVDAEKRDQSGRWLMVLGSWHLLASSVQMPTFLFAYLPLLRNCKVAVTGAPAKILWGMSVDVLAICLAAYLRKYSDQSKELVCEKSGHGFIC